MLFKIPENINFAGYADNNNPYTYSLKIDHVLAIHTGLQKNSFSGFLQITY